jgi:hypothetical protein
VRCDQTKQRLIGGGVQTELFKQWQYGRRLLLHLGSHHHPGSFGRPLFTDGTTVSRSVLDPIIIQARSADLGFSVRGR